MKLLTARELCERQDPHGQRVLRQAAEDAARSELATVGVEIVLLTLLRDRPASAGLRRSLAPAGIETEPMESALRLSLQSRPRGRPGALPVFGEALESLLRAATSLALDEYRETLVAPVRWVETILRRRDQWPGLLGSLPGLGRLGPAVLAAPRVRAGGDGEGEGGSARGRDRDRGRDGGASVGVRIRGLHRRPRRASEARRDRSGGRLRGRDERDRGHPAPPAAELRGGGGRARGRQDRVRARVRPRHRARPSGDPVGPERHRSARALPRARASVRDLAGRRRGAPREGDRGSAADGRDPLRGRPARARRVVERGRGRDAENPRSIRDPAPCDLRVAGVAAFHRARSGPREASRPGPD